VVVALFVAGGLSWAAEARGGGRCVCVCVSESLATDNRLQQQRRRALPSRRRRLCRDTAAQLPGRRRRTSELGLVVPLPLPLPARYADRRRSAALYDRRQTRPAAGPVPVQSCDIQLDFLRRRRL